MKLLSQPKLFECLKSYSLKRLLKDIQAGLSVGIVALPLVIAFSIASGVSPEKGFITSIVGGLLCALLGGSSTQISGATAAFSVIIFTVLQEFGTDGLFLATAMAGVFLIVLGVMRLGTIIKFIPYPIVVGFTSGIAVITFSIVVKDFLGYPNSINVPIKFVGCWEAIINNLEHTNLSSVILVIITVLVAIFSKKITSVVPGSLIAIVISTLLVYFGQGLPGFADIETIGDRFNIVSSMPRPHSFAFNLDTLGSVLPAAFTIAFLGAMQSLLSSTVADGISGDKTDSNTELIGQGVANFVIPFFGGIPIAGAIARTITNVNNGGRSPLAAVVHSILLLGVLLFLMPLVKLIPMAALAGILFIVAYNMGDWKTFKEIIFARNAGSIVLFITFVLTVVVNLTVAIEVGLIFAVLLFLKRISEASGISVETETITNSHGEDLNIPSGVEIYEIEGPFFFGVANKFDTVMSQTVDKKPNVRIIRMRKVPFIDSTGLHNLELLIKKSHQENIRIILSGVNESVRHELYTNSFIVDTLKKENICDNIRAAIEESKALLKADTPVD